MFYFNLEMTGIETLFFLAKPELEPLNSTRIRELHAFGQDVSAWVPENVSRELRKLDEQKNKNQSQIKMGHLYWPDYCRSPCFSVSNKLLCGNAWNNRAIRENGQS